MRAHPDLVALANEVTAGSPPIPKEITGQALLFFKLMNFVWHSESVSEVEDAELIASAVGAQPKGEDLDDGRVWRFEDGSEVVIGGDGSKLDAVDSGKAQQGVRTTASSMSGLVRPEKKAEETENFS